MNVISADDPNTETSTIDELRDELAEARQLARDLQRALDSRAVIEQAKGVLRERFGWSVQDAFEILRYAARTARLNIQALAAEVVNREETPRPIIVAIARNARWRAALMRERAELQHVRVDELEAEVRAQQERLAWKRKEQTNRRRPPDTQDRL